MAVLRIVFPAVALACIVGAAQAGQNDETKKEIARLVSLLSSDNFKVRQKAGKALLSKGVSIRPLLYQFLREKPRTLEAKRRLKNIADKLLDFHVYQPLSGIDDAWTRVGDAHRMFLIDNEWDWRRYKRLLPKLPKVDLEKRHLVVAMSWKSHPRVFLTPGQDRDTLVIRVQESEFTREAGGFVEPKIAVAHMNVWPKAIRFEVNDKTAFTLWKGETLRARGEKQWRAIKRIYDTGKPTMPQRVEAARPIWGKGTQDKTIAAYLAKHPLHRDELKQVFVCQFRRLAQMRATAHAGDILQLAQGVQQHDPASEGAEKALTALGGPAVVAGCEKLLKSNNHFAQHVGIGVLCDFGLPQHRKLFHLALTSRYAPVVRGGMNGLRDIGWKKEDLPAMIDLLGRIDDFRGGNEDVIKTAIYYVASLRGEAAAALPALRKLTRDRVVFLRKSAVTAIAVIER